MFVKKSVARPQSTSAGGPTPKDPNVTIVDSEDILAWPAIAANGVTLNGNFVMKPGAKMIQVYMTPSKQNPGYESEGDEDAIGITQKFEGSYPSDGEEIAEFVKGWLGRGAIIIYGTCRDAKKKVFGTKCSPMKLSPSFVSNNDETSHKLAFNQYVRTDQLPYFYTGSLEFADPFAVADENLNLTKANGTAYQLGSFDLTAALDVASLDLDHGDVVSLIGGGGVDPATLSSGPATGAPEVTVVLKDDTDWVALEDASITLEVYKAGATTYLIERSRS